ncbi:MAG: hypothetical protein ACI4B3_02815 [Prevotella sp.]
MNKRQFYFGLFVLLIICLMGFVFSSCSDDEDGLISTKSLANTKMYVYARESYKDGEQVSGYRFTPQYWYFYRGGTCKGFEDGKWQLDGNSLIITTNYSGYVEKEEYRIIESDYDAKEGSWEIVFRENYEDDEYDYRIYYMRLAGVAE